MVDVGALRSLVTLESTGTVAATADSLGFTPSAVSQQLRRLERELGVELTERVGRGVVLTEAGRLAAARAHALLDDLDSFRADVGTVHRLQGRVSLATFSTGERAIVAPATARLRESAPDLELHVIERDPPQATEALERGEVDLALLHSWVGLPAHLPPQVSTRLVGEDVADVVLPAGHPLAARSSVTPADLADEIWSSVHTGSVCHQWLLQMFARLGRAPVARYWSSEFASQIAYVAAGSAVALIPRLGRGPLPDGVVAVPVEEPVPRRPVVLAWRTARERDPLLRHLRATLAEVGEEVLGPR
ncbi:LysR family transcriptional regulator [Lapillicoccus jejuensis]|uniref:DNA-binding transcriptional LysR family regulator n=1 Tax=Lapillicoccus jejuensis TaxID=402171 RepID=A0A542DZA9_9MICO|nr:LysR family transcriptional regulator [Lapillicoccus jejuensis]TQJ08422.1 DNA-binding transcriptional LysR family regulator [Lapillicoccus jejuensis]